MIEALYVLPIILGILVFCIYCLSRAGFDHFRFKVSFGIIEFSAHKGDELTSEIDRPTVAISSKTRE